MYEKGYAIEKQAPTGQWGKATVVGVVKLEDYPEWPKGVWEVRWEWKELGVCAKEERVVLEECDCDFCCEEVVGEGPRKSVAQM